MQPSPSRCLPLSWYSFRGPSNPLPPDPSSLVLPHQQRHTKNSRVSSPWGRRGISNPCTSPKVWPWSCLAVAVREGDWCLRGQPAWAEPSDKRAFMVSFSHLLTCLSLVVHGYQFSDVWNWNNYNCYFARLLRASSETWRQRSWYMVKYCFKLLEGFFLPSCTLEVKEN